MFDYFLHDYYYSDYSQYNQVATSAYFVAEYFFCFIVMFNLFLLVFIMQYDELYKKKVNPLEQFEGISKVMKKIWNQFVDVDDNETEKTVYKIPSRKVKAFLESFENNYINEGLSKDELTVQSTPEYINDLKLLM